MATRYYITLPDPARARGNDPDLCFRSQGAEGFASELQDALRGDALFERWRAKQDDPDAVDALLQLAHAPRENLSRTVYNIGAFNPSAEEVHDIVLRAFPSAQITTRVDVKRQGIVDSWPADVDDSAARKDFGLNPKYVLKRAFQEYLIPTIRQRYAH